MALGALSVGLVCIWSLATALRLLNAPAGPNRSRIGQYLSPAKAGFHHCALIYERQRRSAEDLLPYVARVRDGQPTAWLFDAFLFLRFNMPDGRRTDENPTTWKDWLRHLDDWFASGRDLHALDEAIERAAQRLGPPPSPRLVVLSVAYPIRSVEDFDLIEEGRPVSLATDQGVGSAVGAYVAEAIRRFTHSRFRHLQLWGFYWMREEISPQDEPRVRAAAQAIHRAGCKLLWIPWWRAPGFDRWRDCGIDAAILQPNYAFVTLTHGGAVRRNRLAAAAELARKNGMGVEIEAGDVVQSLADRQAFLHYLADGGPDRLGYREGACAYYLGVDTVERAAAAPRPEVRYTYQALSNFVTGRSVPDPDPPQTWRRTATGFTARLARPARVRALDILFDEPSATLVWKGRADVYFRRRQGDGWRPAGWAVRTRHDEDAGRYQVMSVPVFEDVAALDIRLHPLYRRMRLSRARLVANSVGPEGLHRHTALGASYTTDLTARRKYDDDGTKLTDGVVPAGGFGEGKSVGWIAPQVAVCFDLAAVHQVTRVEVVCQGGSGAWVNWPTDAVVFLSEHALPPTTMSATGSWAKDIRWEAASPVEIIRRRSAVDMDGILRFSVLPTARARYVNVLLRGHGWIMLSEVRIFDGKTNLAQAPGVHYTLRPLPTDAQTEGIHYPDDGLRLTDGIVAATFTRQHVVGWDDGQPKTITVDLGVAKLIRGVTVWSLRGGQYGIFAPEQVNVEVSTDGHNWTGVGSAERADGGEDGNECVPAPYRVVTTADRLLRARYVRVRIRPARGWSMVSEVEVDGSSLAR